MNKTFKVVFNKARGALMVVNEATSSMQKKGTKTIIATAVVTVCALGSGLANASLPTECVNGECVYDNKTVTNSAGRTHLKESDGVKTVSISNSSFSEASVGGYFSFYGTQNIKINNTKFADSKSVALYFASHFVDDQTPVDIKDKKAVEAILTNVMFENNKESSIYSYDNLNFTMTGGAFKNNVQTSNGGQALGAAAFIKSGKYVFQDVDFINNVAQAKGATGFATGGAVLVDMTTTVKNDGKNTVGDVTFKITKDKTYYGNKVQTESSDSQPKLPGLSRSNLL